MSRLALPPVTDKLTAVIAVLYRADEPLPVASIAEQADVNLATVRDVLRRLASKGWTTWSRRHGGAHSPTAKLWQLTLSGRQQAPLQLPDLALTGRSSQVCSPSGRG
jgi:DNA-binding IclR family transcriptional regulator